MEPPGWLEIVPALAALLLLAVAQAAKSALPLITRPHAKRMAEENRQGAEALSTLVEDSRRAELSLALLRILAILFLGFLILRWPPLWAVVIFLLLLVAISVPRAWALGHAQAAALLVAGPAHFLTLPLRPLVGLAQKGERFLVQALGGQPEAEESEEEFRVIVGEHEEELPIEEDEKEMIASIFEFGQTLVREVMVPRTDVAAVEVDTPLKEGLEMIIKAGHSRIPVYRENIDHVVGILYAKDLLKVLKDGSSDVLLEKIIRPAYFVPETNKVDELLAEMQARRVHMAIVIDEYGGTAGLVTIEDLIEEIVGEIQDEYDTEEPSYTMVTSQEYVFDARTSLHDVNHLMDLELPTEEGDTLAGLVLSRLGRVPMVGEEIILAGAKISILAMTARRIRKVRVTKLTPPEGGTESG